MKTDRFSMRRGLCAKAIFLCALLLGHPAVGQVSIQSPQSGDVWNRGTTHTISWTGPASSNGVLVCLDFISPSENHIVLFPTPPNPTTWTWTVPGTVALGYHRICVYYSGYGAFYSQGYFTIGQGGDSDSEPAFEITPHADWLKDDNGDPLTEYLPGDSVTLPFNIWCSTNTNATVFVQIAPEDEHYPPATNLTLPDVELDVGDNLVDFFTWEIPEDTEPGTYDMLACVSNEQNGVLDTTYPGTNNVSFSDDAWLSGEGTSVVVRAPFELLGIEVTQCIQNWSNDVALIANKLTAVRASIVSDVDQSAGLAVKLLGKRAGDADYTEIATQCLDSIPMRVFYQRSVFGNAVTFVIGTDECWTDDGQTTFAVMAVDLVAGSSFAGNPDELSVSVNFLPGPRPQMRLFCFDDDFHSDAESLSRARDEFDAAAMRLPCSGVDVVSETLFLYTTFADAPGGIDKEGQIAVLDELERRRHDITGTWTLDDEDIGGPYFAAIDPWYSAGGRARVFLQEDTPLGGNCMFAGASPLSVAHEIGHLEGRLHVNSGNDEPSPYEDGYPNADGRISVSTNQLDKTTYYGLRPHASRPTFDDVYPPTTSDIMSYAPRRCTSPHMYDLVLTWMASRFPANAVTCTTQSMTEGSPVIRVSGTVSTNPIAGGFTQVYKTHSTTGGFVTNAEPWTVRVLDGSMVPLAATSLTPTWWEGVATFATSIPRVASAATIELRYGALVVDSVAVTGAPPSVVLLSPNGGETLTDTTVHVSWQAEDIDTDRLQFSLEYSADAGVTWTTLVIGMTNTHVSLLRNRLKASTNAILRIAASDGFTEVSDKSDEEFTVANNAPSVCIMSPSPDDTFRSVESVVLMAGFHDTEDGITPATCVWTSSADGQLTTGTFARVAGDTLTAGTHVLTVTVEDADGASAQDIVTVKIVPDADVDGMPDDWETVFFGSVRAASYVDSDGDGVNNIGEYYADTNPTNSRSFLGLTGLTSSNGLLLGWQGGTGAWQYIECRSDLGSTGEVWRTLFTNEPPTAIATNIIDAGATNQMLFYRIRAERK